MRPPRREGPRTDQKHFRSVYLPAQMVAAALAVGTYLDLHLNSKEDIEDVPVMKALWCCMPCLK